jgi:hypothetical protein
MRISTIILEKAGIRKMPNNERSQRISITPIISRNGDGRNLASHKTIKKTMIL